MSSCDAGGNIATYFQIDEPVIVRGRVVQWLEGDAAWEVVDRISTKYTGGPYGRDQERVVALIEPDHQKVGMS